MGGWGRRRIAARFEIGCTVCLDVDGRPTGPLPPFAENRDEMVAMYRAILATRTLDAKAVALQRTGRLGTYASALGQEAPGLGVAMAMRAEDVLAPSFREQSAQLVRGVSMLEQLMFWGGDERGSDVAGPREDLPICIPVGDQFAHAVGVALAFQLRGEARAVAVFGGDGATSKGDFHEALNLAGVWGLPVLFVIVNNGWAISLPRSAQTAAETLAQKAVAAGVPGEQVDGNDAVAVRAAAEAALDRARDGGGPSLIECMTYRLADHTTADDATRYRDDAEVSAAWAREPARRLRMHLAEAQGWTTEEEEALRQAVEAEVDAAAEAWLASTPAPAASVVDHLFETVPKDLEPVRHALERRGDG